MISNFAEIDWIGKPFQVTKILFKSPKADWPKVVVIWAPSEGEKVEIHIFERISLSGFDTWEFTIKEDSNLQKQIFLLNLRLWLAQK